MNKKIEEAETSIENQEKVIQGMSSNTSTAAWMSAGFAAAMLVLAGVSLYLTWEDMKDFYKVDFSPIPHYMVDETAITYYKILGDCADLNGDVGQQWVALYACWDNEACQPILADSMKAVTGSSEIPAGYESGIHMFGSDSAFNLNNKMYDWNQSAPKIFVYFQVDKEAPVSASTSGSAFTGGWIAIAAFLGMGLGAVVTAVSMHSIRKKKETLAEA